MKRYLIALDMDGTLLTSQGDISPITKACLQKLEKKGHLIVIASGRPVRSISKYYEGLQLQSPIVCYNGAYVTSPHDRGFKERCFSFPQEVIKQIHEDIGLHVDNIMCETNKDIWLLQEDDVLKEFFWHDNMNIIYGNLKDTLKEDPMTMIIKSKHKGTNTLFLEAVRKHPGLCIRFWNGMFDLFSEIYYEHVSKAEGLRYIADLYDIPRDRIIAFGDAENDLEMIEFAGTGVAMKNGISSLKEKADMVSLDDNDHDGIAKTLEAIMKDSLE